MPARDLAHQPFVTFPVSIIRTGSARVVGIFLAKILSVRISLAGPVPSREAYLLEHGAWLPGCLLIMLLDWGPVEPRGSAPVLIISASESLAMPDGHES